MCCWVSEADPEAGFGIWRGMAAGMGDADDEPTLFVHVDADVGISPVLEVSG